MSKPQVGVSACLLGHAVRFNGDHKRQPWITDILGKHAKLVPFCPEVSLGLGVPRPTLRLNQGRLVQPSTKLDLSEKATSCFIKLAQTAAGLDGFILKKDSPSCGLERVKDYSAKGIPNKTGQGFFAKAMCESYPLLPMIEEGRLMDSEQRENFLNQIFAYSRLRALTPEAPLRIKLSAIQDLHKKHKLILMEHSPRHYSRLGRIVANPEGLSVREVLEKYSVLFMEALAVMPTAKTRTNVLEHAMGYLRGKADETDRKQLRESIKEYLKGELPFIAPLTLANHLIQKFEIAYLQEQLFFAPYPRALGAHIRL